MTRAALRILRHRLGFFRTLPILARVAIAQLRGAPWKRLPPAADEKERLSRREIGGAVLLHQALSRHLSADAARGILSEIIVEGAMVSFDYLLDPLTPATLRARPEEERRRLVLQNLARFPNADARLDEAAPDRLAFTVTHCRFPVLLAAVGHPELAPLFCAGDKRYFEERLGVDFNRPHTIADGAANCPFLLTARPSQEP